MKKLTSFLIVILFSHLTRTQAQTVELLNNGDFTSGYSNWNASQYWWVQSCFCPYNAGSAGNYAYFGKTAACDTVNFNSGTLYQDFLVPPGANNFNLSFAISINSREVAQFTKYDSLLIQIRDQSNAVIFQLDQFSNLNGDPFGSCAPYNAFNYPMPALALWAGQTVRVYFLAANDIAKSTVFRLDDISLTADLPTTCVTWLNETPVNTNTLNAAEYLCGQNIIENFQDGTGTGNTNGNGPVDLKLADLAFYTSNAILGYGVGSITDNYPCPFSDLQNNDPYSNAVKRLLYLEYSNNVPSISRDHFYVGLIDQVRVGRAIRAVLRAFNFTPDAIDSLGYNPNDNSPSNFICDVLNSNEHYPWIKKAFNLGLFNGLIQSCGNCSASSCWITPGGNNRLFDKWEFLILLANIKQNYPTPSISIGDYYVPNSFNVSNINNSAGIDRAVFNSYECNSFKIPSGGLSLEFNHSYNSSLAELPFCSQDNVPTEYSLQNVFGLGKGWVYSYNSRIHKLVNDNNICEMVAITWDDGTINYFNVLTNQYESKGVTDELIIDSIASGIPQKIRIIKKDGTVYTFAALSNLMYAPLYLLRITDKNNHEVEIGWSVSAPIQGYQSSRIGYVADRFSFPSRTLEYYYQTGTNFLDSVVDKSLGRKLIFNVNPITKNLDSFTDAKGQITTYQYNATEPNLLTNIQLPKGNSITNSYYKRKLQSSSNGTYGIQVNWNQNYLGNGTTSSQVSVTQNGNTLTTSYNNDPRGNPISIVTPTGTTTMQYQDLNNPDQPTYINDGNTGITTTIQYEPNKKANPILISKSGGGNVITDEYHYNAFSEVIWHKDPDNNITNTSYDSFGNISDITPPIGTTHFNYNANKLVESIVDPVGLQTNFHYNFYGNLDSIFLSNTTISSAATQDGAGRQTSIRNPNGIRTEFTYDPNDNILSKRHDPLVLNLFTQNTYDANDNLKSIISPRGLTTNLNYDFATDDLISESYGPYTKLWTYNQDGTTNSFTNKNGVLYNYSYLPLLDPNAGKLSNDGYSSFTYDGTTKNLQFIQRGLNRIEYSYDGLNRIKTIIYNDITTYQNKVTYEYYPNSNRLYTTDYPVVPGHPIYNIQYNYDANNRIIGVKNWFSQAIYVTYNYRDDGKLNWELFGNGVKTNYYYDNASRLDSMVTTNSNGNLISTVTCTKDLIGNHLTESTNVFYNGPANTPSSSPVDTIIMFQYNNMNRLTSIGSNGVGSNGNGAVINNSNNSSTYLWDERDNMLSLTNQNGTNIFEYDPLENRRRKDSTRYVLDLMNNENVLMETDLNGVPSSIFVHGLGLVCRIDPVTNKVYYYHYDFRGSTIAITDSAQEIVQTYEYDAFGKINNMQGSYSDSTFNSFTYVGKHGVMDEGNGLYFMRARYYDTNQGRFIAEDPKWDTNLFPYGNNNPVTNIDPNGDCPPCLLLLGEASISIASGFILAKATGQDYTWKNAALDGALGIATAGAGIYAKFAAKGVGRGFKSFSAFKNVMGSAGEGQAWHHIVEQTPSNIAKFGNEELHNTNNLMKLPHGAGSIHNKISGYYSSIRSFTNGKTVRKWLSSKSYQEQYEFGVNVLKQFGFK